MENDIQKLKIDYSVMSEKLDHLKQDNARIEKKIDENNIAIVKKLDSYIMKDETWKKEICDHMEQKFAQKWVEKTVLFIMGIAATAVVVAIMKLIIN